MKKYSSYLALVVLGLMTMLWSCKKDNNNPPKTRTELITQANWRFKTATANGSDVSGLIQDCQKDNIISFAANGNGNMNEGATKCNSGDPDDTPFTWNFASSETVLNISTALYANGSNTLTLVSLTETELVVEMPYNPPFGSSVLMKITFNH